MFVSRLLARNTTVFITGLNITAHKNKHISRQSDAGRPISYIIQRERERERSRLQWWYDMIILCIVP